MPVGSITFKRKTSPRTRQGEQEVTFCSENRTDVKKNRTPSRLRGADPFHYSQTMRDSSPEDHATPHGVGLYILSTLLGASDNWKGYNTEVHGARSWMGGAHWDGRSWMGQFVEQMHLSCLGSQNCVLKGSKTTSQDQAQLSLRKN